MWRNLVIDSQSDFRSRGWNNAGANLLALAVGLANRHYLYVRPRLTPRDFGYALAPALPGILIASLISYLAEPAVLPQMAALGCVLGLLGKIFKEKKDFVKLCFIHVFQFHVLRDSAYKDTCTQQFSCVHWNCTFGSLEFNSNCDKIFDSLFQNASVTLFNLFAEKKIGKKSFECISTLISPTYFWKIINNIPFHEKQIFFPYFF